MSSEQSHNKQTNKPEGNKETRTEKNHAIAFLVLSSSTLGFIKKQTNSRNRYNYSCFSWSFFHPTPMGKLPWHRLTQIKVYLLAWKSLTTAFLMQTKNSLGHTLLYFLWMYQKEVYSVQILRTKECLTVNFFLKQMSNPMNTETFDASKKAN